MSFSVGSLLSVSSSHGLISMSCALQLAIGRKNYLFCGDDDAAQGAAVVYSLLATCKVHGVDERTWLEDVLRSIPEYELGQKEFSDLLPDNWLAAAAK